MKIRRNVTRMLTVGLIGSGLFFLAAALFQHQENRKSAEERIAVFSGRIVAIDPGAERLVINRHGQEIIVQTETLTAAATSTVPGQDADLAARFAEGMLVTVEGRVNEENTVIANRLTHGGYYDTLPYSTVD